MKFYKPNGKLIIYLFSFWAIWHTLSIPLRLGLEFTEFYWTIDKPLFLPGVWLLGDSQILSGLSNASVKELLPPNLRQENTIRLARPSEQPEGILSRLKQGARQNIRPKHVILNISPITVSKNDVVLTHQSLVHRTEIFDWVWLGEENLRSFYLGDLNRFLEKPFLFAFPLLRWNGSYSLVLGDYLKSGNWDLFWQRKEENQVLSSLYPMQDAWTWRGSKTERVLSKESIFPKGMGQAFGRERKEGLRTWSRIFGYLKSEKIPCTAIRLPFSPDLEEDLSELGIARAFAEHWKEWESQNICKMIVVPGEVLGSRDQFADWTHANLNGRISLLEYLLSLRLHGN